MRGVLALQLELWTFGSPGGLQVPTFGSVGFTLTLSPKWGCDINKIKLQTFNIDVNQCEWTCGSRIQAMQKKWKKIVNWKKLKVTSLRCIQCRYQCHYAFVVNLPPSSMVTKEFGFFKPIEIHHISCIDPPYILVKYTY
jgi:hypothetical protein